VDFRRQACLTFAGGGGIECGGAGYFLDGLGIGCDTRMLGRRFCCCSRFSDYIAVVERGAGFLRGGIEDGDCGAGGIFCYRRLENFEIRRGRAAMVCW